MTSFGGSLDSVDGHPDREDPLRSRPPVTDAYSSRGTGPVHGDDSRGYRGKTRDEVGTDRTVVNRTTGGLLWSLDLPSVSRVLMLR